MLPSAVLCLLSSAGIAWTQENTRPPSGAYQLDSFTPLSLLPICPETFLLNDVDYSLELELLFDVPYHVRLCLPGLLELSWSSIQAVLCLCSLRPALHAADAVSGRDRKLQG